MEHSSHPVAVSTPDQEPSLAEAVPTAAPISTADHPASAPEPAASRGTIELQVFFSTFVTVLLAELGDKTQMTTLLMSAESHAPWVVFAGAGTALVATSLIGVWLGCWLSKRIPPHLLEKAAGGLLLLVSAQLFWEVIHL